MKGKNGTGVWIIKVPSEGKAMESIENKSCRFRGESLSTVPARALGYGNQLL